MEGWESCHASLYMHASGICVEHECARDHVVVGIKVKIQLGECYIRCVGLILYIRSTQQTGSRHIGKPICKSMQLEDV